MEDHRYLSGAQDLYLSPGCLKLFSFSIMHCINQQIQCELQYKCFHVYLSNHLLHLCSKIWEIKKSNFLLVEERRRREKEKEMEFCFLFMFLIMLLRRLSTSCTVRIRWSHQGNSCLQTNKCLSLTQLWSSSVNSFNNPICQSYI